MVKNINKMDKNNNRICLEAADFTQHNAFIVMHDDLELDILYVRKNLQISLETLGIVKSSTT